MIPNKAQAYSRVEYDPVSGLYSIPKCICFKTKNELDEFFDDRLDSGLCILILSFGSFVDLYQPKSAVITEIWRSPEEQAALYPNQPDKKTMHNFWKAVDFRSWNLDIITLDSILQFFTQTNLSIYRGLLIYHTIKNNVFHLHLQVG